MGEPGASRTKADWPFRGAMRVCSMHAGLRKYQPQGPGERQCALGGAQEVGVGVPVEGRGRVPGVEEEV